jgi:hypothetical protein
MVIAMTIILLWYGMLFVKNGFTLPKHFAKELMNMIKCPNCGSTAQVKVFVGDDLNNIWVGSMGYVKQHLICGCGCEFIRQFVFDSEYVVNDEEGSE